MLYFISLSVKYISCKRKGFQNKCELPTHRHRDLQTNGQSDS